MKKYGYYSGRRGLWGAIVLTFIGVQVLLLTALFDFNIFLKLQRYRFWTVMVLLAADGLLLLVPVWILSVQGKRIRNQCRKFVAGEIYNEFLEEMESTDELLSQAFRRMDALLNRQDTIKLATKQAEFLALQNQINPHFLYNTLDAIRGDALSIGAVEIADITEALSTFFQYTITNTRHLVSLEMELESVNNYFTIQKYRFGEKLSLEVRMADDSRKMRQMLCPKLMLQPIVENAIFHGLETVRKQGKILILVELVDDMLRIEISDNGAGIDAAKLKKLNEQLSRNSVGSIVEDRDRKEGGIALLNVCRRIKLLFGEQYGLRLNSVLGAGTLVEISLPARLSEEL